MNFNALSGVLDIARWDAAVVMTHHLQSDVRYLRLLGNAQRSGYIGLLGPTARRERVLSELGADAATLGSRLRGPVGLDIGAVTPESIALAIVSEIHAWLAGRKALPSQEVSASRSR
jgi:xanthine dehydrogenase accessory factor